MLLRASTLRCVVAGGFIVCVLQGTVTLAPACQYCRNAATDPEAARMAAQMHSGGFPLDATINQFQAVPPAATLTAPPAPGGVAISVAGLPGRVRPVVEVPPAALATPMAASAPAKLPTASLRWADVGLFGLLAAGGWFYWRTRRVSAPVA